MTFPLRLLAHDLRVPENVGSLFRISDALGVERLHLTGRTPIPPHAKIRRLARATEKTVSWRYDGDPGPVLKELGTAGYTLAAVETGAESRDVRSLAEADYDRIAIVVGAEREGLPPDVLERCSMRLRVPMFGLNTSMNVAQAAAIALWEAGRRFYPFAELPSATDP